MSTLTRFLPALTSFVIALINALDPAITQFVAAHPDIAVNGYALLTTIANAIHPTKPEMAAPQVGV